MAEDAFYRSSTQYRLWSFTPDALHVLRTTTNRNAAERVRAAYRRARAQKEEVKETEKDQSQAQRVVGSSSLGAGPDEEGRAERAGADNGQEHVSRERSGHGDGSDPSGHMDADAMDVDGDEQLAVECLTVHEELRLVRYYCGVLLKMSEEFGMPGEAKATAVQYFKRFYLTNSIMTYAPKTILKTALFFATKTEHHFVPVKDFAARIANTTVEEILASEFILTQGLRFTFDVRHPLRAHIGAMMELEAICRGKIATGDETRAETTAGDAAASHIPPRPKALAERVAKMYPPVREMLKMEAQISDVYFHFSPSQIMLAAMWTVDEALAAWYLGWKTRGRAPGAHQSHSDTKNSPGAILQRVQQCAAMLTASGSGTGSGTGTDVGAEEKKELRALTKKLARCMDPDKGDLVGLQRAKREGAAGVDADKAVKKRRLEREAAAKEGENLFGPALTAGPA